MVERASTPQEAAILKQLPASKDENARLNEKVEKLAAAVLELQRNANAEAAPGASTHAASEPSGGSESLGGLTIHPIMVLASLITS